MVKKSSVTKKAKAKKPAEPKAKKAKKVAKKAELTNHLIISKSDDPKAKWYVVHTYSGHEVKVAHALKQRVETMGLTDKVLELLIPTQNRIKIAKGKKLEVAEKIFPGYLLIRMILTDDSWLTVRTTTGITSFVGIGNKPTPLPKSEVEAIQKFMEMEAPKYKTTFTKGEAVKIIEGPFADFLGSIDSIDEDKGKVKVLVSIFGRETPVELDFLQVSKI
jgi:transcriptional antiterminator NusG